MLGDVPVVLPLVKAMVFDETNVFASTRSEILKVLILRATLPRDKSLQSERETKVSLDIGP